MSILGIDDPEAAAKRWNHTADLLEQLEPLIRDSAKQIKNVGGLDKV